jgi:hypothetical protein
MRRGEVILSPSHGSARRDGRFPAAIVRLLPIDVRLCSLWISSLCVG